jgi:AcrR family transcriptional regulator
LGLSSGALFRHFKTMDEVLEAVVERMVMVLSAALPPADSPPLKRLIAFVELRSHAIGDNSGILQLVVSEQFRLALPAGAAKKLKRLMAQSRRFVLQGVLQGQQDGSVRKDVPAADLALLVMGLTQMLALSKGLGLGLRQTTAAATLHKLLAKGQQRIKGDAP